MGQLPEKLSKTWQGPTSCTQGCHPYNAVAMEARHRKDLLSPSIMPTLFFTCPSPLLIFFCFSLYLICFSRDLVTQNKKTCSHLPSPSLSRSVILSLSYALKSPGEIKKLTLSGPTAEILIPLAWACIGGQASR